MALERRLHLSDEEFRRVVEIAQSEFGLHIPNSKRTLVSSRLQKRIREYKFLDFSGYLQNLENPNTDIDYCDLIEPLTTNVTGFFREPHHFEIMAKQLKMQTAGRNNGRIRIWSAGCSSGPETYSIAMVLSRLGLNASNWDNRILATDIDDNSLRKARSGVYKKSDCAGLTKEDISEFFDVDGDNLRVKEILQKQITFAELNLSKKLPMSGRFDFIFCRNVSIYFDKETQNKLWIKLSEKLRNSAILFLGHSERLSGPAVDQFKCIGTTAYQYRAPNLNDKDKMEMT